MKAPVYEIFSSIQGEGLLVGKRQIFVRFAGCNLDCIYCDTPKSRDPKNGKLFLVDELYKSVKSLVTPDLHSICLTGGEPLLYADFIKKFLKKCEFNALLETNGSLPDNAKVISKFIDYAAVDIKLPRYITVMGEEIIEKEIETINILMAKKVYTYCKIVVLPSTKVKSLKKVVKKIRDGIVNPLGLQIVLQPSSPLKNWIGKQKRLLKMSEIIGKDFNVRIIPQIHKILKFR